MLCKFALHIDGFKILNNFSKAAFNGQRTVQNMSLGAFFIGKNVFKCDHNNKQRKVKKNKKKLINCQQKLESKALNKCINENICKGKKNLSAVLYTSELIRLEEREKPKPCAGEVVIAMNCVGLSNSDATYYKNGIKALPLVIGCDGTGIVAELGEGVRKFREGDRVVVEPNVSCDRCSQCRLCKRHLCPHMRTFGMEPYDGLLQCYHAHDADYCHKLSDNLTMEEGVLIGYLAIGLNVCQLCPTCPGSPYLIVGAGLTGLAVLLAAKAMGATNVCLLCKCKERLDFAKQFKTKTVRIHEGVKAEDIAQTVREVLGSAPAIAVDTVGSEGSVQLAIASVADGGNVVLANTTDAEAKLPLKQIVARDLSIRSALCHNNKYPAAIALAASCAVNLKPLISHHFYFEEITKAMGTLINGNEFVNKIIVHIRPRNRNNPDPF